MKPPQPNARAPKILKSHVDDEQLNVYLDRVGKHDVMLPDTERALAQAIEDAQRKVWSVLLTNIPYAELAGVIAFVEEYLDEPACAKLAPVVKATNDLAEPVKRGRAFLERRLETVAGEAAIELRTIDFDQAIINAVVKEYTLTGWIAAVRNALKASLVLRDRFITANLKIVVNMARRSDKGVMPLADLIQEGNLGLMHALSRFDWRRNIKFSTYAAWWIRHAINRSMADKGRTVRIPVHMLEQQLVLDRAKRKLVGELGREPTPIEIAGETKLSVEKVTEPQTYLMGAQVSTSQVVSKNDERTIEETIADPATEEGSPLDGMTMEALLGQVKRLLHCLTPMEADVLSMRFGLGDTETFTFKEIGAKYALSRERIRQMLAFTLEKLKAAVEAEQRGDVDF